MTAAPHATRMTTNAIVRELDLLAREATDLAEDAARFAADVDRGVRHGSAERIKGLADRIALRAASLDAMQRTADLFTAELNPEVTP